MAMLYIEREDMLRDSLTDVYARLDYLEYELRRITEHTLDDAFRDAAEGLRRLAQENDLSNMNDEEFEQAFMQIINP